MSTFLTHPHALQLAAAASHYNGDRLQKERSEEDKERRLRRMLFSAKVKLEESISPQTYANFFA